jgi:hypothetical protein
VICLGISKVAGITSFAGGDVPEHMTMLPDSPIERVLNTIIVLVEGDVRSIYG